MNGWDQVTHVTGTGVDVSYQYDGLGGMVVRTNALPPALTAGTTFYYYAGQQMIESVDQQLGVSGRRDKGVYQPVRFLSAVREFADSRYTDYLDL